jgi:hypothetical protein
LFDNHNDIALLLLLSITKKAPKRQIPFLLFRSQEMTKRISCVAKMIFVCQQRVYQRTDSPQCTEEKNFSYSRHSFSQHCCCFFALLLGEVKKSLGLDGGHVNSLFLWQTCRLGQGWLGSSIPISSGHTTHTFCLASLSLVMVVGDNNFSLVRASL